MHLKVFVRSSDSRAPGKVCFAVLTIGEPMMDSKQSQGGQASEDIAAVYSSANFQETLYRDFCASRIDARARFRYHRLRKEEEPAPAAHERALAPPPEGAAAPVPAAPEVQPSAPPPVEDLPSPQWLDPGKGGQGGQGGGMGAGSETLQRATERVASRWFALQGLFARSAPATELSSGPKRELRVPVIAVFSFAGGVGKTSLIATLGRALASHGERVLLADTTPFGLLPFYFGSRDLKAGVVRTFTPPNNGIDAPVDAVILDVKALHGEGAGDDQLVEALLVEGHNSERILVDVQTASEAVLRRLLPLSPTVLAPLLPEMNSVVSVNAIESIFSGTGGGSGMGGAAEQNIKPIYLLNQFDASLPLHVDVREILQEQLGDRLLPFVVRRSPAVSEALAEGMTVFDYAPNSSAAEDYLRLATWFGSISAATGDYREVRWSER
jgi:cellulose biosynthesis protein BcsQ